MSKTLHFGLKTLAITSIVLVLFSLVILPIVGQVHFIGMLIFSCLGVVASGAVARLNPKQQIWKLLLAINLLFLTIGLIIVFLAIINL